MARQRQLNQNSIDCRIGVQPVDQCQQRVLRGVLGKAVFEAGHAAQRGLLGLRGDIDLAGRIIAHQHHREARLAPGRLFEGGGIVGHAGPQPGGEGLAVDHRAAHARADIAAKPITRDTSDRPKISTM